MADKVVTVTAPTDTTPGLSINMFRTALGTQVHVSYVPVNSALPSSYKFFDEAAVAAAPLALRNAINTLFTAAINAALAGMGF